MTDDDIDYDEVLAQEERDQAAWEAWWNGLTDEERERERQMMAAYVAEKAAERKARGYDV